MSDYIASSVAYLARVDTVSNLSKDCHRMTVDGHEYVIANEEACDSLDQAIIMQKQAFKVTCADMDCRKLLRDKEAILAVTATKKIGKEFQKSIWALRYEDLAKELPQ